MNLQEISTDHLNIYSNRLSVYIDTLKKQRQQIMQVMAQRTLPNYDFNSIMSVLDKEINDCFTNLEKMSDEINSRMGQDIGFIPNLKELQKVMVDFYEQMKAAQPNIESFNNMDKNFQA